MLRHGITVSPLQLDWAFISAYLESFVATAVCDSRRGHATEFSHTGNVMDAVVLKQCDGAGGSSGEDKHNHEASTSAALQLLLLKKEQLVSDDGDIMRRLLALTTAIALCCPLLPKQFAYPGKVQEATNGLLILDITFFKFFVADVIKVQSWFKRSRHWLGFGHAESFKDLIGAKFFVLLVVGIAMVFVLVHWVFPPPLVLLPAESHSQNQEKVLLHCKLRVRVRWNPFNFPSHMLIWGSHLELIQLTRMMFCRRELLKGSNWCERMPCMLLLPRNSLEGQHRRAWFEPSLAVFCWPFPQLRFVEGNSSLLAGGRYLRWKDIASFPRGCGREVWWSGQQWARVSVDGGPPRLEVTEGAIGGESRPARIDESEFQNHEIPSMQHFYTGIKIKLDSGSELGSFDLGSGTRLVQTSLSLVESYRGPCSGSGYHSRHPGENYARREAGHEECVTKIHIAARRRSPPGALQSDTGRRAANLQNWSVPNLQTARLGATTATTCFRSPPTSRTGRYRTSRPHGSGPQRLPRVSGHRRPPGLAGTEPPDRTARGHNGSHVFPVTADLQDWPVPNLQTALLGATTAPTCFRSPPTSRTGRYRTSRPHGSGPQRLPRVSGHRRPPGLAGTEPPDRTARGHNGSHVFPVTADLQDWPVPNLQTALLGATTAPTCFRSPPTSRTGRYRTSRPHASGPQRLPRVSGHRRPPGLVGTEPPDRPTRGHNGSHVFLVTTDLQDWSVPNLQTARLGATTATTCFRSPPTSRFRLYRTSGPHGSGPQRLPRVSGHHRPPTVPIVYSEHFILFLDTSERRAAHEVDACPWSRAMPHRRARPGDSRVGHGQLWVALNTGTRGKPTDQHDSHLRKSGVSRPGIEPSSPCWEASSLTAQPPYTPEWPWDRKKSDQFYVLVPLLIQRSASVLDVIRAVLPVPQPRVDDNVATPQTFPTHTPRRWTSATWCSSLELQILTCWSVSVVGVIFLNSSNASKPGRLLAARRGKPGFNSRPSHSQFFASGNRAERCRWSAGFLGSLPFPPPLHSGSAPFLPHFTLTDSQDLVCDENTARQCRALRLTAMAHLMLLAVSTLALPRYAASNVVNYFQPERRSNSPAPPWQQHIHWWTSTSSSSAGRSNPSGHRTGIRLDSQLEVLHLSVGLSKYQTPHHIAPAVSITENNRNSADVVESSFTGVEPRNSSPAHHGQHISGWRSANSSSAGRNSGGGCRTRTSPESAASSTPLARLALRTPDTASSSARSPNQEVLLHWAVLPSVRVHQWHNQWAELRLYQRMTFTAQVKSLLAAVITAPWP
ncbi:hypothetical protein PR048_010776 [Dryococelus australis]|uniref:Uncharacterized protein n=1 Tax=Dryococelus australis TaxID=614101 RepID=A0ABQ9I3N8_9NEOP|nr:hypothetical protein PR048_010776 [Dryococelus australis]